MSLFLVFVNLTALFIYHVLQSVFLLLTPRRYRRKKDIGGQRVLITGAGNGLGRQLAIQFSELSTCVVLLDIDKGALLETLTLLDPESRAFVYECDITNRKMVYAVAEEIKADVGEVDILVNNAGIVTGKSLIDLPDDNITKTLEVNALSHFWICKSFVPTMMARNSGHIVTVASMAGRVAIAKLADYCASKYAAIGFSESLELEMRVKNLDGIKVTIVCPSVIDTGLFQGCDNTFFNPLTPKQVAEEIVEGVLEETETVFIPSCLKYLAIMKTIAPRWLHHSLLEQTGNMDIMKNFTGKVMKSND